MAEGSGLLRIRDAESDYPLESPTAFAATMDDQTGAVSGGSLTTPPLAFSTPVLGGAAIADVIATFTEVAPATATGSIDPFGNVIIRTALRVDLHIDVGNGGVVGDCTTVPVQLELLSTAPYSAASQSVTVRDADFSIPAFAPSASCESLIVGPLNELLQGPGHALSMTLTGSLALPPEPGDPSVTTLQVDPSGGSNFGEEVVIAATVVAASGGSATVPTGAVTFRDGSRELGTVTLVDGVAILPTSALGAGPRQLIADYSGSADFAPSSSLPLTYTVRAVPWLDVEISDVYQTGAEGTEVPLTVENPSLGADLTNAAVRLTLSRGAGVLFPTSQVAVSYRPEGGALAPVTLTTGTVANTITGLLGPTTGRELLAGGELTDGFQISFPVESMAPGPLAMTFELLEVDPSTGAVERVVRTTTGVATVVRDQRNPTELSFDSFFFPPIHPSVVRAGNTITIPSIAIVRSVAVTPTGTMSFAIDGVPVLSWTRDLPGGFNAPPRDAVPVQAGTYVIDVPPTVVAGTHTLTASYSGDASLGPSSISESFTVVPPTGRLFDCVVDPGIGPGHRHRAQVRALANLPRSAPAGIPVPLSGLDVELFVDRSGLTTTTAGPLPLGSPSTVGSPPAEFVEFGFGGLGTGTAATVTRTGDVQYDAFDTDPDMSLTFGGETGSVTLAGAPGTVVPVALDTFTMRIRDLGTATITCTPVGAPIPLGSIEVAGTTLAVDAPTPTRADDEVVLTAQVAPAAVPGTVAFYEGERSVAIANPVGGVASASVTLGVGSRSLTARFHAGAAGPSTTSAPVTVEVLPAVECDAFAEEGNGAVVRLVYMELLRRCPDQAGFDHWVDRLDNGTSPEAFARSIARTAEAVGVVVNDGYQTMLGRPADSAGRTFWTGRLQGHGRYDQLLADLAASDEFWTKAGSSNEGFVTRVYERLLNRAPDQAGLDYWVGRLDSGASRRALVLSLANLDEPLGRLVVQSYGEILSRAPFSGERATGIAFLRATGDRSGLYAELIGRPEFTTRAQGFPNPED